MQIKVTDRYTRIAFVGEIINHEGVYWLADEGTMKFVDIFISRPNFAKLAILQDSDGKYLVVNLHDTMMRRDTLETVMPEPLVFDDLDAAVMAATMKQ